MTERSLLWTDGAGDGGPYAQDSLRLLLKTLAGNPGASGGVLNQLNGLTVYSTGNNNIRVRSGRAIIDGTLYETDAEVAFTTANPSIGTTGRLIVLQKSWSARTVRLAIISSADGTATIPAVTQSDGVTWEIPLASFTITTAGAIGALTDRRQFAGLGFSASDFRAIDPAGRAVVMWSDCATTSSLGIGIVVAADAGGAGAGNAATASDPTNGKLDLAYTSSGPSDVALRTSMAAFKASLNPRFTTKCRFVNNGNLTAAFVGFYSATAPVAGTTNSKAGLRVVTTGNLFFVTGNGVSEQTTDLGAVPATDDVWDIYTVDGGASWICQKNGVTVATHATTLPATSTGMYGMAGVAGGSVAADGLQNIDYIYADQNRS